MSARLVGMVMMWTGRGFGFIMARNRRFFVHTTWLPPAFRLQPLTRGERVVFTPEESPRGPRAIDLARLPACCAKCDAELRELTCSVCGFSLEM